MTFEELAHRAMFKLGAKGVKTSKIEIDIKLPYSNYVLIRELINQYAFEKYNAGYPIEHSDMFVKDSFSFRGIKINLINVGFK